MSSTNRGTVRRQDDWFETPDWCVDAVLPRLPQSFWGRGNLVLDAGAGRGSICHAIHRHSADVQLLAVESRMNERNGFGLQFCDPIVVVWNDFLSVALEADAVIMNPPFELALEFVKAALQTAPVVVALLRQAFAASKKRRRFHLEHPSDMFVLPKRPSFTPDGRSDSSDYAWFVWGATEGGHWEVL